MNSAHAFVASPEIVTPLAMAGTIAFNPITKKLFVKNDKGEESKISGASKGFETPAAWFCCG